MILLESGEALWAFSDGDLDDVGGFSTNLSDQECMVNSPFVGMKRPGLLQGIAGADAVIAVVHPEELTPRGISKNVALGVVHAHE